MTHILVNMESLGVPKPVRKRTPTVALLEGGEMQENTFVLECDCSLAKASNGAGTLYGYGYHRRLVLCFLLRVVCTVLSGWLCPPEIAVDVTSHAPRFPRYFFCLCMISH